MPTITEQLATPPVPVVATTENAPEFNPPTPPATENPYLAFSKPAEEKTNPYLAFSKPESNPYSEISRPAEDFDLKSVEELVADRDNFSPREYYASHPGLASNPKDLAKLLEVYRQRDKEGLKAGQVVKEAAKEAIPTVGKIFGGARDLVAGAINVGLQPAVNLAGSVVTGDIFNPQMREELVQETKRVQKKAIAETAAGSETAATGLAVLARTGLRKLDVAAGQAAVSELGEPPVEKSDQQLLQQINEDVAFSKQMQEVSSGKGETAKSLGLDADTLAKEGVVLDPAVIERLSLVDPLTIVAGGGVFKAVNAAGKVVFTAATRAAAERTIGKLLAQTVAAPVRAIGKTAELTGKVAKAVGPYVPLMGRRSLVTLGGKVAEAAGKGVAQAGEALANSATFQKALVGAAEGVAAAAPLAAASEDDKTAGAIFGAGALLGGGARGLVSAAEAPGRIISGRSLAEKPITFPDTKSRPYGISDALDSAHELGIQSLPKESQNAINSFRETVRDLGGEVYVLTPDVFEQTLLENVERANGGQPLNADQLQRVRNLAESQGYFDTSLPTPDGGLRRVVMLNNSADPLTHEVGHLFHSLLSPERQADLLNTAKQVFTPEEIAGYKKSYEEALGKPVTEAAFLDELVAENFSQLFRNTPISELTVPRGLTDKLGRTITDFAEQLGLDLTAETRTPLGLPSSLRFNDVVRDAARDILTPRPSEPVVAPRTPEGRTISPERVVVPRPPRARVERPVIESRPTEPVSETAAAEEARTIAAEAPDLPQAGGTKSPRELLGQIAESIAKNEGVKLNYLSAPDEPAAATTSNRTVRREIIEAFRTMPPEARALWEKTFFPEKVTRTAGNKYQIQGWAPEVFASNAHKLARFMAETPEAQTLSPYAIDPKTKSFTPEAWQELYQDTQRFVQNQMRGATGAGEPLVVPRSVSEAGGFAPATRPGARALDQGRADFINLLFNFKLPETPRTQAGRRPLNVVGQEVSAATKPGRVEVPVRPRGEFTGEEARRQGIEGVAIAEVNPLRNQLEAAALAAKKPMPSFIEAIQKLNLENIKEVQGAPEQPQFRGNTLTLGAGFHPRTRPINEVVRELPPVSAGYVRFFHGEGGAQGAGVGGSFFTSSPERASTYGPNVSYVDVPAATAVAARKAALDLATGGDTAILNPADVNRAKALSSQVEPPVFDLDADVVDAKFQPAPSEDIRTLAEEYSKRAGIPYEPKLKTAAANPDLLKRVADFYAEAKSDPNAPEVKASYDALAKETINQYNAMVDAGYVMEPWEKEGQPYASSADMVSDVRDNHHLYYFKTEKGYGNAGDVAKQNAMLADSGVKINGESVPVNDLFRGVHDFFGHAKEGHQFGPKGEFNAWGTHAEMFSDAAQGALAAETLAQNAFVNFGPHMRSKTGAILQKGEPGYLGQTERPFAEQKNIVVPPEIIAEARAQFQPENNKWKVKGRINGRLTELLIEADKASEAERIASEGGMDLVISSIPSYTARKAANLESSDFTQLAGKDITGYRAAGSEESVRFAPKKEKKPAVEKFATPSFTSAVAEISSGAKEGETFNAEGTVFSPGDQKLDVVTVASKNIPAEELTPERVREAAQPFEGLLDKPYVKLGLFRLGGEGAPRVSVDLNAVVDQKHRKNTEEFARANNQESFFDLVNFETIQTGGDGNTTLKDPAAIAAAVDKLVAGEKVQFAPQKKKGEDPYVFKAPKAGFSKAWILPSGDPVQLGGTLHHQWLAENPEVAAKYGLDVPAFEGGAESVKEGALKKGFARVNYSQNSGLLTVEARARDWRKIKSSVERMVESNLDSIDKMEVHLLNETADKVVDSQQKNLFNYDDAEKLQHLPFITEGEVRGKFQPKSEKEMALDDPRAQKGIQKILRTEVMAAKEKYPEALPLEYRKEEDGSYRIDAKGKPTPAATPYDLYATPLAKDAAKGKRGDEARDAAVIDAYANKIKDAYKEAAKNPDIAAGANWYSLAREKLSKLFGPDTKFFTELLGATSAKTPVDLNFRSAVDAYNNFKAGKYDAQIKKYREGKSIWESGELPAEANLGDEPTRAAFMEWWIKKHDLKPRKSNGTLFGQNSDAVMRVFDGSWREVVKGPKTPNFAGNLSGDTFEATIDVWAARLMHRLGNEGNEKRWRILPKNETAVSDPDFFMAQKAFRKAGDELGVSPDSLQAIMWFAEKHVWEKNGWTKAIGAAKSDFNTFLNVTAKEQPSGRVKISEEDLKKPEKKADKKQLELLPP